MFLVAWYQAEIGASIAGLNDATSSGIMADKHAILDSWKMRLDVEWPTFSAIDLTAGEHVAAGDHTVEQNIGESYVVDPNGDIKPNTATGLVKSASVKITFDTTPSSVKKDTSSNSTPVWSDTTEAERHLLNNVTFTVKLKATNQLRIATALANSGAVGTDFVGAYDPTAVDPWITIGEVKIAHTNSNSGTSTPESLSYTYKSVYGHTGAADAFSEDGLSFVYSISPKSTTADTESTTDSYGTFVVEVIVS